MTPLPAHHRKRGFTLPEILTVVGIIGVLSAIAIPAYTGLTTRTQDVEAQDFVESLNRAVLRFGQANWDIPTAANPSATTDETTVLLSLQYKWSAKQSGRELRLGSPYFTQKYKPSTSSDSTMHRLRWNGRSFELLKPGTAGSGLLKTFDGKDQKDCVFPNGFLPAGTPTGYVP